jgi:tryptophan synthase alpha chain
MSKSTRIDRRFAELKAQGRGGLVTFITAGDPDPVTSAEILAGLPAAGADLIELGMPFSDPMADGPAIQLSSQRALAAGMTLLRTLEMVAEFRKSDDDTPIILMGYFNPIYVFGVDAFVAAAVSAGVDGLIIVDLPPEEEAELCAPARTAGINFIFLTAPTTDEARLPQVMANASGFVYYVSITGITGTASASAADIESALDRLRRFTDLPIAVGFGINTPEQAGQVAKVADAAVVGSALIKRVAGNLNADGSAGPGLTESVLALVRELAAGVVAGRVGETVR